MGEDDGERGESLGMTEFIFHARERKKEEREGGKRKKKGEKR